MTSRSMIRRTLDRELAANQPHIIWNAFLDLVAMEDYEALSAPQRIAHLAFWYDAEVQDGGHLQYFENSAGTRSTEALVAVAQIGGPHLAAILREAIERWASRERERATSVRELVAQSLELEFGDLDERYHQSSPSMQELLERYLSEHEDEFIAYSPAV